MEASVIQQDVGVTLYVENAPEPSPTPDASASPSPTPSKSAKEDDAENEKTPLLGVAATITLTDAKGNATDYELDTETGTALAEDMTPATTRWRSSHRGLHAARGPDRDSQRKGRLQGGRQGR